MADRLAQHFIQRGLLDPGRVEDAQRRQALAGGCLDTALLEGGQISEAGALQALADVSGQRLVNLADFEPNHEVASLIPPRIAERLCVVPLSVEGGTLHVACAYPIPQKELEEISFLLNKKLELWVAVEARVRDWSATIYGTPLAARYASLLASLDPSRPLALEPPRPAPDKPPPSPETTLEDELGAEPIPLEVRKADAPGWFAPATADRVETAWVDPVAYQAFAREVSQAPEPPPEPAPTQWSLAEARAALKESVRDRDRILDVALHYARQTFDFVAAFAVIRGAAVGWDAVGEGASRERVIQISLPLDAHSVFRTVALTRGSFVGPLPPDPLTQDFLARLGRTPRSALVFPVDVRGRLAAILYGDSGARPVSQRRLSDLILFLQDLAGAFQELLVFKKQRDGVVLGVPFDADRATQAPAAPGVGWSPHAPAALPGLGRAASVPVPIVPQDERPPPDFDAVLRRLTGPDAAARSRAMAELASSPEASARVLARHFPGPTAWSRLPVVELPEAEELGPIPGALTRLGRPGAQALAPLLDADDPDTRYFALLTAGNMPNAELVDGALRGLFDLEPDISSAARAAAASLRRLPRFDAQMPALRRELASVDSLRRTLAARALGALHDRDAVDGLIGLTGSEDHLCAQAAAEALREITKASLGTQPRAWSAWWADNRSRPRAQWLVAGLKDADFDIRLASIEELSKAIHSNLGYFADAPLPERDAAVRRWEDELFTHQRLKRLDL